MAEESENNVEANEGGADAPVDAAELVEELSASSRRRRQEASHQIAEAAKGDPSLFADSISELIDALDRPEAQTRWEVLNALTAMTPSYSDEVVGAIDGAEASLFDDDSATVRLASFLFLCEVGSTSAKRSDEVWPLLDEAVQCYHGDAEYRDMLSGLLSFANGSISKKTAKSLSERVSFDAEHANGFTQEYSEQIVAAAEQHVK